MSACVHGMTVAGLLEVTCQPATDTDATNVMWLLVGHYFFMFALVCNIMKEFHSTFKVAYSAAQNSYMCDLLSIHE